MFALRIGVIACVSEYICLLHLGKWIIYESAIVLRFLGVDAHPAFWFASLVFNL